MLQVAHHTPVAALSAHPPARAFRIQFRERPALRLRFIIRLVVQPSCGCFEVVTHKLNCASR